MDWVSILAEEARGSGVLIADELAKKHATDPRTVSKALSRYERRGLVERVTHKVYVNKLAPDFLAQYLVNILRPES